MSLELSCSSPQGIFAKTFSSRTVLLGDYEISMSDFCALVMYVLTNTNLDPSDPRYDLVDAIKKLKVAKGFPTIIHGKEVAGEHRFEIGE